MQVKGHMTKKISSKFPSAEYIQVAMVKYITVLKVSIEMKISKSCQINQVK